MPAVHPDVTERARHADLAGLIGRTVRLKPAGSGQFVGRCPFHVERTPSFRVYQRDGHFHCFGCGAHGDAITFVMRMQGVSFIAAVEVAAGCSPIGPPRGNASMARVAGTEPASQTLAWCRSIWRSASLASGTPVETYMQTRGMTIPLPATLRFHPRLRHSETQAYWPVMVAPIQNLRGHLIGLHRTFLEASGLGKAPVVPAKKMAGHAWGGAIRLAPTGEILAIAEGIETALSVMQACPSLPVWATGSLGNLAGRGVNDGATQHHPARPNVPLPTEEPDHRHPGFMPPKLVRRLIILADGDGDPFIGSALIERARRRFERLGLQVTVAWPTPGCDFNDLLVGKGR